MFVQDAEFLHTGYLHQPETHIGRSGVTSQYEFTVIDEFRRHRIARFNFNADLRVDNHWRIRVFADYFPSFETSGTGDPTVLFLELKKKFEDYFKTPVADRVPAW